MAEITSKMANFVIETDTEVSAGPTDTGEIGPSTCNSDTGEIGPGICNSDTGEIGSGTCNSDTVEIEPRYM